MSRWTYTSGAVISRRFDVAMFVLVPLAGLGIAYAAQATQLATWFSAFSVALIVALDYSHLLATWAPLKVRAEHELIVVRRWLFGGAVVAATSIVVWNYDHLLFHKILAVFVFLHQVRQLYGWMAVARRSSGKTGRVSPLDRLMLANITMVPFLYNASDMTSHPGAYIFVKGDMALYSLSTASVKALAAVYAAIAVIYLAGESYKVWRTREIDGPKYLILASSWFCFSYCYTLAPFGLYWLPHTLLHGFSYLAYNYKHLHLNKREAPRLGLAMYAALTLILGLVFYGFRFFDPEGVPLLQWIYSPLIWSIPLAHYIADSLIWRRSWTAGLRFH